MIGAKSRLNSTSTGREPWYYQDNIDRSTTRLKLVDAFWFEEMDGEETRWITTLAARCV